MHWWFHAPQVQLPSGVLVRRQMKQKSVLHFLQHICLQPFLCSIRELQFGQARIEGTFNPITSVSGAARSLSKISLLQEVLPHCFALSALFQGRRHCQQKWYAFLCLRVQIRHCTQLFVASFLSHKLMQPGHSIISGCFIQ